MNYRIYTGHGKESYAYHASSARFPSYATLLDYLRYASITAHAMVFDTKAGKARTFTRAELEQLQAEAAMLRASRNRHED